MGRRRDLQIWLAFLQMSNQCRLRSRCTFLHLIFSTWNQIDLADVGAEKKSLIVVLSEFFSLVKLSQRSNDFKVYFQVNMCKNEQKVQFTVIHVQGNHVHLKEHLACKTNFTN